MNIADAIKIFKAAPINLWGCFISPQKTNLSELNEREIP